MVHADCQCSQLALWNTPVPSSSHYTPDMPGELQDPLSSHTSRPVNTGSSGPDEARYDLPQIGPP